MKLQAILMAACPRALYMCDRNAQGANLAQTQTVVILTIILLCAGSPVDVVTLGSDPRGT